MLRIALAFAFAYPAISGLIAPNTWIISVPSFVGTYVTPHAFLLAYSILELLLAFSLLIVRRPVVPAVIAVIFLLFVIIPEVRALNTVYREVSLLFTAIALALLSRRA
jgi:hypothetical protein